MVPSSSAQKVTTNFNDNFDFTNHKRYAWGQNHIITRQGRENDALIDQKIVQDVNHNLTARGFIEDTFKPDFFISYDAGAGDLAIAVEGVYSPPRPQPHESPFPIYGIPQNVWYSVDGHITFQITEAVSNKSVWTATARKKIRDPHKGMKDMDKQVEQIVSKVFKSFPPRIKSPK